jgi:hypothetical protein
VRGHEREITGSSPIAGASGARSYTVRLGSGSAAVAVPFRLVQGPNSRWFIEQIDIEAITTSRLAIPRECRTDRVR